MSQELNVSSGTIQRIINEDLKVRPYKKYPVQFLSADQKKKRRERCAALLWTFADDQVGNILFTDEKIFTVEQTLKRKNSRVYAPSLQTIPRHILEV